MPRVISERAIGNEPVDVHAALEAARQERLEQSKRDEAARQRRHDLEAKERADERERQRLAMVTPVSELPASERAEAVAKFEAAVTARKFEAAMAKLVLLPALLRRGDGELFVRYERFDAGEIVADTMPLDDAGVLLKPATSPTLRIDADRREWEQAQAARAAEEAQRQLAIARFKRLQDRRDAEVARLKALPAASRAALFVSHEATANPLDVASAFARLARHLAGDDTEQLKRHVESTITDEE